MKVLRNLVAPGTGFGHFDELAELHGIPMRLKTDVDAGQDPQLIADVNSDDVADLVRIGGHQLRALPGHLPEHRAELGQRSRASA